MGLNLCAEGHVGDFDPVVEQGNASISIDESCLPKAEDIAWRGVGLGQGERTEEAIACFSGLVESNVGDLLGCRMYLVVVVALRPHPKGCSDEPPLSERPWSLPGW